jgi:hypothetical protein
MTHSDNQLFSVEDALAKLAQNKSQGCLLVSKGAELIHIYVQDGFVLRAHGSVKEGPEAVDQAIHLKDSSFTWLRGTQPPNPVKVSHISILELIAKFGNVAQPKMIATGRLNTAGAPVEKKETDFRFKYFLVPDDRRTEKLYLTKASTVMGRDPTSDLFIDNADVSWRHCLLDIQASGVSILDLNSTNGTFLNGKLVQNAHLNPGDKLELGPCLFTVNREALHHR